MVSSIQSTKKTFNLCSTYDEYISKHNSLLTTDDGYISKHNTSPWHHVISRHTYDWTKPWLCRHTHTHTHTHTQEIHKCVQRLLLEGRFCIPLVWINYISRHGPASHPWLHSMVMSTLHISAVQYKIPSIVRPRLNLKETSIYIYITDI